MSRIGQTRDILFFGDNGIAYALTTVTVTLSPLLSRSLLYPSAPPSVTDRASTSPAKRARRSAFSALPSAE